MVGKIFYAPDDYTLRNEDRFIDRDCYAFSALPIMRTCKQIHEESEEVYLSKNLFVLPDFPHRRVPIYPKYLSNPTPDRPLCSPAADKYLKNISVSFNPRMTNPPGVDRSQWIWEEACGPSGFDGMIRQERQDFANLEAEQNLQSPKR